MSVLTENNLWTWESLRSGNPWERPLAAYWEVEWLAISDDYGPLEISAEELLQEWITRVGERHPDGLIPIYWYVFSPEDSLGPFPQAGVLFEAAPFAHKPFPDDDEDFLTFFSWPMHAVTGQPLNWHSLPVVDQCWNESRPDEGGFVQQATGWKPGILQPHVYLPTLMDACGLRISRDFF